MDKQECLNITELLSVTWDKPIDQASLTVKAKGYWEYIGDLPYDAVKQTVKEMVNWIRPIKKDFEYHLPLELVTEQTPKTWTEKLI